VTSDAAATADLNRLEMAGDMLIGILGVIAASFGWGSNFVCVKGYDMKDGFAFQLWLCTGVMIVGLLCAFAGAPDPDYAPGHDGKLGALNLEVSMLGVLGGALWALGNLCTVKIINNIGLGLGLSLWGGFNLVSSFAIGQMGPCIGSECLDVAVLGSPGLGGTGCALSVLSLVCFGFVKPKLDDDKAEVLLDNVVVSLDSSRRADSMSAHIGDSPSFVGGIAAPAANPAAAGSWKRLQGIGLAVLAGLVYGVQFLPGAIYAQEHNADGSQWGQVRFFFSQYLGIFLLSLTAYVLYVAYHAARGVPLPEVPLRAMLPAMLSGVMWAIAGAGVMFAIAELSYSVGFPLCLNGAFLVNCGWSVLYYREISGRRNLTVFGVAAVLSVVASIMISLSK